MKDIKPCPYCKEYMYIRRERWICSDYANCGYTLDLENGRAIGGGSGDWGASVKQTNRSSEPKQLNAGV